MKAHNLKVLCPEPIPRLSWNLRKKILKTREIARRASVMKYILNKIVDMQYLMSPMFSCNLLKVVSQVQIL